MRVKAVIFDLDGTLLDSEVYNLKAWQEVWIRSGREISDKEYIKACVGQSKEYIAQKLSEEFGLPVSTIIELKDQIYSRLLAQIPLTPMPYALEILEKLSRQGLVLALATGGDRVETEHKLEAANIKHLFKSIVTSSDVEHTKPHPQTYLKALYDLSFETQEALAVEDTPTGYLSANSAGIRTLVVRNYMNTYTKFPTDDIFEGLEEIYKFISRLISPN